MFRKKERKQTTQGRRTAHQLALSPFPINNEGFRKRKRKKIDNPREGWEDGTPPPHRDFKERRHQLEKKERKKTDNPREGWEDGTPPPHRDFKERGVMR